MKTFKKWLCICLSLALFGFLCACTEDKSDVAESSTLSENTTQESESSDSDETTDATETTHDITLETSDVEETQPSDTTEDTSSDDTTEESSVAEETQPSESIPDDTSFAESVVESVADSSTPQEQQPSESTPDDTSFAESVTDSDIPDDSQPAESTPVEKPPVESSQEPEEPTPAVGTKENPQPMVIGDNKTALDGKGEYYYSWTATENATLSLQLSGATKTGWAYQVYNVTAGDDFTKKASSNDTDADSTVYLSVFKGDIIQVAVNTATGAKGNVTLKASLLEEWGTESNPITIVIGETNYLRVPAGKTVYFCGRPQNTTMVLTGASNSVFEFEGESHKFTNGKITVEMPKSEGGRADVLFFSITNNNGSMKVYSVTCDYPVGTTDNPAKVNLGSNSVQIEGSNQYGYVYEWTATEKGTVTITMTGSNWHYEILNINTMVQEQSNSNDDSPVKETTINVRKGQIVRITINSGDGKAANVTFNFSFN